MSTQLLTKIAEERNQHEQRITPNGTLFEFLASPDETGSEISLIRGTVPPGAAVPLHSHRDVELFYVLEGTLEVFQSSNGSPRWTTIGAGDTVTIPGNTKHALRNSSPFPTTMVVVTTAKLYEFFHEVTKPFDPGRSATPPTPKEIQELLRATEGYGYWMGSPEENAAIGLVAPSEQKQVPVFANPKPKVDWRALQQAAVLRTIK
jgi:quercetin dioxygenase-like cupin family protein